MKRGSFAVKRVSALLLAVALLYPPTSSAAKTQWRLWPSPFASQEILDQSQTLGSRHNRVIVKKQRPVGQVFVPSRSPLLRIEFRANNRYDQRPGRVRLYRWQENAARTRKTAPLFEDSIELSGDVGYQIRSVFPRLDVAPGEPLYMEFSVGGRGEFGLDVAAEGKDLYPAGHLEPRTRPFGPRWDLWFKTFAGSGPTGDALELEAHDPPFQASVVTGRWQEPLATQAAGGPEAYLERVRRRTEATRPGIGRSCRDSLHNAALSEALLYRSSCKQGRCDESAVESLLTLFRNSHAIRFCRHRLSGATCKNACDTDPDLRFHWLKPPVLAYLWTRSSPTYQRADHELIKELLVDSAQRLWPKLEIGVHNRAITLATGYLGLSLLYPEHALAPQWREHADAVWQEFRSVNDTLEDSAQYTTVVWMPSVLAFAELAGEEDALFSDPGFLDLVERIYAQTSPLGTYPNFGDGSGWARDPAGLVWLMEKAASHTQDARYRWLAKRVADYATVHPRDERPKEDALHMSLPYLANAALDADPSLEPLSPPASEGSLVTTRREARPLPREDWEKGSAQRTHVFEARQVPNKLVLRSGFDPGDLHAVVNLLAGYQHGQTEIGAFVSLVDERSVLLADTPFPYSQHTTNAEDESAPLLRRYWGGRASDPGRSVDVTHFRDAQNATVAWLEWDDPAGWGVRQERRILFVKNRFLLVRDRFHFPEAIGASAGPVWHAGDVQREHGESWFDISYREPLTNVWKVRNPERYALLYFVPRPGRRANAFLESSYLPPEHCRDKPAVSRVPGPCLAGPPHVLYQRWTGEAAAGTTLWFDTLVLPHGPELTPGEAASRVRVLHSDEVNVALEVTHGDETWTVIDRPGEAPLRTPELDTDARYALLRTAAGREPYALTRDATRLVRRDLRLEWPVSTSVERGATLPVGR